MRTYRQVVDQAPNHVQAWFHLGLIAYRTGRHEELVRALRRAIRIQPGLAEAHNNLGSALARLGKLDEAAASFQEALRLTPDYCEALNNLANVHRDQGRLDEGGPFLLPKLGGCGVRRDIPLPRVRDPQVVMGRLFNAERREPGRMPPQFQCPLRAPDRFPFL
jgi:tetratricopeptide (TPR) repeat protein